MRIPLEQCKLQAAKEVLSLLPLRRQLRWICLFEIIEKEEGRSTKGPVHPHVCLQMD